MAAAKLDLLKRYRTEYVTPKAPVLLTIGPAKYLAFEGRGAPASAAFQTAVGALYAVAFTIKMTRKFAGKRDYAVGKLEALWPNLNCEAAPPDKEQWEWQFLIRTPKFVSQKDVDQAITTLLKRGKGEDTRRVELRSLTEGTCVQALHVGPYEDESRTVAIMKELAEKRGLRLAGPHHEIYLSDPRRVEPAKLKTILREPVAKAK